MWWETKSQNGKIRRSPDYNELSLTTTLSYMSWVEFTREKVYSTELMTISVVPWITRPLWRHPFAHLNRFSGKTRMSRTPVWADRSTFLDPSGQLTEVVRVHTCTYCLAPRQTRWDTEFEEVTRNNLLRHTTNLILEKFKHTHQGSMSDSWWVSLLK